MRYQSLLYGCRSLKLSYNGNMVLGGLDAHSNLGDDFYVCLTKSRVILEDKTSIVNMPPVAIWKVLGTLHIGKQAEEVLRSKPVGRDASKASASALASRILT